MTDRREGPQREDVLNELFKLKEEVSVQVQSAIAPLSELIQEVRDEQKEQTGTNERKAVAMETISQQFITLNGKTKITMELQMKQGEQIVELREWRKYIMGGMAMLTLLLVPVVITVVIQYINQKNAPSEIRAAVYEALNNQPLK